MANKTRVYKVSDWSLWVDSPADGSFVLDVSLLDGADVLGTSTGSMKQINAEITNLTISEGGDNSFGVLPVIAPPALVATLNVKDFVISDIRNYYIGKTIWVLLKNEQTFSDPVYGTNTPMFFGIIRDFDVTTTSGQEFSTITLQATTKLSDWLNTMVTVNRVAGSNRANLIGTAANALGMNVYFVGTNTFGGTSTETLSLGDWAEEQINTDLVFPGFKIDKTLVANGANYNFNWYERLDLDAPIRSNIGAITEVDIVEADFAWHNGDAPTSVKLTNANLDTMEAIRTTSLASVVNQVAFEKTVDVNTSTELGAIADTLVNTTKAYKPKSVTVINAITYQDITFENEIVSGWNYWINPLANVFAVGRKIDVTMPTFGVATFSPIIIGRTMEITQDNWTTTYDLWTGY